MLSSAPGGNDWARFTSDSRRCCASQKLVPAVPVVAPKAVPIQGPEALRGFEVESSDQSRHDALCKPRMAA